MNKLRFIALSSGFVLATSGAFLVACSDDTSVSAIPEADGGDADGDANTIPGHDAGPGVDGAPGEDGGPSEDAGADAEATDAGQDAAPFDAGLTVDSYVDKVAATLCTSMTRCCFGPVQVEDGGVVDGGTYDASQCVALGKQLGFDFSNSGVDYASRERIELDQQKAVTCLQAVESMSCALSGVELRAARAACYGAIKGKQKVADVCSASIECAAGYCKPVHPEANPVLGNRGVCSSLAAAAGNCGAAFEREPADPDVDQQYAEEVCSTRGGGDTGLHCSSYNYTSGQYNDRASWTCVPGVANGEHCSWNSWCATGVCDTSDYTCKDPVHVLEAGCFALVKKTP